MGEGAILFDPDAKAREVARREESYKSRPRVIPPLALHCRRVGTPSAFGDWFAETVSATFEPLFSVVAPIVPQRGIYCSVLMTDSGANGELRVVASNGDGTVTSAVHVYPAAGTQNTLAWLHGLDQWTGGPVTVTLEGRRTAGAGRFYANLPSLGFVNVRTLRAGGGVWYPGVWLP